MNIVLDDGKKPLQNLNEGKKQDLSLNLETLVLKTPAKQFKFECGVIMARMSVKLNTRFGLYWHKQNTKNLEEFLNSVEMFVNASNNIITDSDKKLLSKQYNK